MARVRKNIITQGLSGTLGGALVFRQRGDETIVSTVPVRESALTPAQQAVRTRFQQGVDYAKGQVQDRSAKDAYQQLVNDRLTSAYSAAVRDFLHAPEVRAVDGTAYTGAIGSGLTITAVDDFEVIAVSVRIERATGTLVETGNAVQQPNGNEWLYTATASNGAPAGSKVTVRAVDRPGNVVEQTFIL
jgi:hypothetical protein